MGQQDNGTLLTSPWNMVLVAQIYYNTSVEDRTTSSWERRESMDTSSCLPLHARIPFTLQELFPQMWVKENDKMIPQSIPLKHKRYVIREWRPPTWDLSQEGIWKGNRHGANQTPHEERKMCDNFKNTIHWHTKAQTGAPWGFFHQNYCTNQHNTRNKFLAGFKVIFW